MTAQVLMVQGTSSSAGKSLLVTALCRIFAQDGLRVAPFKAQNMSLNSYVTAGGHEIGRAQVVQAEAAGIAPHVDMNPVLLKPEGGGRSQVVVMGRPWQSLVPADYYERKQILWNAVTKALARLRAEYDLVIIEGAGSPAEINLRESDIVNMAVACHAQAPVLLVGDIDRGGVFASLLGTLLLLENQERRLVKGLVINKFRGEQELLVSGLEILEERAQVPVLGVIHYLQELKIAEEDSVALESLPENPYQEGDTEIAVIRLPRISNFDEFDALALEPKVRLRYVSRGADLGQPAAIILPGTKHTLADLAWLRAQGLDRRIRARAQQGAAIVGICGGYQMLGQHIMDPLGVEADPGEVQEGLGLLSVYTEFEPAKTTHQAEAVVLKGRGFLAEVTGKVAGYEIHMGQSRLLGEDLLPLLQWKHREGLDGAMDRSGRIWGSYLHGIFDNLEFRRAWLKSLNWTPPDQPLDMAVLRQGEYDRLAAAVRASLDMDRLRRILETGMGTA
jgi:adenosylcobyric acid synthase